MTQTPVINLNTARQLKHENENSENIMFPVSQVNLNDVLDTNYKASDRCAIIRTDTNEILGIHSNRYTLTPNEIVFQAIEKAIKESQSIDTNGMTIKDSVINNGSSCVRSYIFPEHNISPKVGDLTQLRIRTLNSYDGSSNLQIMFEGLRLACLNGMTTNSKFAKLRNRHVGVFDKHSLSHYLRNAVENFYQLKDKWEVMYNTPITLNMATQLIEDFTKSERLRSTLIAYFIHETKTLGSTQWALYNALTYWSTHEPVKKSSIKNQPAIELKRSNDVAGILNHQVLRVA